MTKLYIMRKLLLDMFGKSRASLACFYQDFRCLESFLSRLSVRLSERPPVTCLFVYMFIYLYI